MVLVMLFPQMVRKSSGILTHIYRHSFNQQLYQGNLSTAAFMFYLQQDTYYLHEFAIALRLLSKRFTSTNYKEQFEQLSNIMIAAELDVRSRYLGRNQQQRFFWKRHDPSEKIPVISEYSEHLINMANFAPLPVAVSACMACSYIYSQLGQQMKHVRPDNPYREWIDSYSGVDFLNSTQALIQTANTLGQASSSVQIQQQACEAFKKSASLELQFFDAVLANRQLRLPTYENASTLR